MSSSKPLFIYSLKTGRMRNPQLQIFVTNLLLSKLLFYFDNKSKQVVLLT